MDTDRCALSALCLSAPLSMDPRSGIYEARGLITAKLCGRGTAGLYSYPSSPLNSGRKKGEGELFIFPPL